MTELARSPEDLRAAAEAYWAAVTAGDVGGALAAVERAGVEGSPQYALEHLVRTAQARVGRLWERGEWSVAQEHAATAVSEAVARRHLEQALAQLPPTASPVVVACAEREWHAMPGLLLAVGLARRGVGVVSLGADVSSQRLHGALLDAPATAVLVSASLTSSLPRVRAHVETARMVGTPVVVGGHAFDGEGRRARAVGATAQARDAATAAELLPSLPRHVPPAPPLTHDGAAEAVVLEADGARIVDRVRELVLGRAAERSAGPAGDVASAGWLRVLVDQLPHVVGALAGALLVQDATVVAQTHRWLHAVLVSRTAPPTALDDLWWAMHRTLHDFPRACDMLRAAAPA